MTPTTRTGRALVTGASAGIGRAFATTLAARGYTVTAVARGAAGLDELRAEIGNDHEFLIADLATTAGVRTVTERLDAANYAVLVNNAGTATHGEFIVTPVADALGMLDLNCRSVIELAHHFLAGPSRGQRSSTWPPRWPSNLGTNSRYTAPQRLLSPASPKPSGRNNIRGAYGSSACAPG